MKPIVFLDFDGVIITYHDVHRAQPHLMARLNRIIEATGAEIVISSSWRIIYDAPVKLKEWGCVGKVIDITPRYPTRGYEIRMWLATNNPEGQRPYLILDDQIDGFSDELKVHHIETNFFEGLTEAQTLRAIEMIVGDANASTNNAAPAGLQS